MAISSATRAISAVAIMAGLVAGAPSLVIAIGDTVIENQPPTWVNPPPDQSTDENVGIAFTIEATDADVADALGDDASNDAVALYKEAALAFARGDRTPLPDFAQDAYVEGGRFGGRTIADLADEFEALRLADHPDGAQSPDGRVQGTYVHGLFGADAKPAFCRPSSCSAITVT